MNAKELFNKALEAGIALYLVQGQLRYKAKKGAVTAEIVGALQDCKEEMIQYLEDIQVKKWEVSHLLPPIEKVEKPSGELSFAQQRLWFIDQLEGGSPQYNMPTAFKLLGKFDFPAFNRAISTVIERHEILRTRFELVDGQARQIVRENFESPVASHDLTQLNRAQQQAAIAELARSDAGRTFNLSRDLLIHAHLITLSTDEHVVLFNMHHIVSDGWSMGILVGEFVALYDAFTQGYPDPLPALKIQYADYAHWQRQWLQGDGMEQQLGYWLKQLQGIPQTHSLVFDKPRLAEQSFRGGAHRHTIGGHLTTAIHNFCRRQEVTLYIFLQTAFAVLMGRYSGEEDIVIGGPVAGRANKDLENLMGFFVNSVVVRTNLQGNPDFTTLLERNRKTILDAYTYQHLPFELLVEKLQPQRSLSYHPVFQIIFAVQNTKISELVLPDLKLEPIAPQVDFVRFDLQLDVFEGENFLELVWYYDSELFYPQTIARMAENLLVLLQGIVDDPQQPIHALPLLSEEKTRRLTVEWNTTAVAFDRDHCVHEMFERQALERADSIALAFGQQQITYELLNRRANRLAHYLIEAGLQADSLVGLLLERSAQMLVAMLGVLKAGGAYVPLDPGYPQARLDYMLQDAAVTALLTRTEWLQRITCEVPQVLCLDSAETRRTLSYYPDDNTAVGAIGLTPEHLAYVIYTSGSTGLPRGVTVSHRNVTALLSDTDYVGITAESRIAQASTATFDAATFEIWGALANGAALVYIAKSQLLDARQLAWQLRQQRVSVMFVTTALLNKMIYEVPACFATLDYLLFGGEQVNYEAVAKLLADGRPRHTAHVYGPTEVTTFSTTIPLTGLYDESGRRLSIGRPMANTRTYVLDRYRQVVDVGCPGELYIGGDGVARGYLNREALSREKFIQDPFSDAAADRLYRSGDLVRWLSDGSLDFIGRIDTQVKIRGFRIELGEIETQISQVEAVKESVVDVKTDHNGDKYLVAYICPKQRFMDAVSEDGDSARLEEWTNIFDDIYAKGQEVHGVSLNISGWMSSYSETLIDKAQMQEWVDGTLAHIGSLKPQSLLEIGCGTGLLLYRYAPQCQQVYATDISAAALAGIRHETERRGWSHIDFHQGNALDFAGYKDRLFDTVVINSVVQYFPSSRYLLDMLEGLLPHVVDGGHIFLGDIRNLDILEAFAASIEWYRLGEEDCSVQLFDQRVQRAVQQEEELLLSPTFFAQLPQVYEQIGDVDIMIKRGVGDNEMLRYRYDVILHIGRRRESDAGPRHRDDFPWFDGADGDAVLSSHQYPVFGLYGLTNRRIVEELRITTILQGLKDSDDAQAKDVFAQALEQHDAHNDYRDLEQYLQRADAAGYRAWPTWSQHAPDQVDIVFSLTQRPRVQAYNAYRQKVLTSHPQLKAINKRLVPQIKRHLSSRLPGFMVPDRYVLLAELPLNANGKVDRKVLPEPIIDTQANYVEPGNDDERRMQAIWQEILNLEPISVTANFFELGGHSLLATRLISAVRDGFQRELSVRALFDTPTIAELCEQLRDSAKSILLPPIQKVDRDQPLILSYAQQRLWFIDQLNDGSPQYNMSTVFKLHGELDVAAFTRAMMTIIERHEVLRTRFQKREGQAHQVVGEGMTKSLAVCDFSKLSESLRHSELEALARQYAVRPFDLSRDLLLRLQLVKLSAKEHAVILNMHHIASDGWSIGVLTREFGTLYNAFSRQQSNPLPPLAVQYADYAHWQRQWLQGEILQQQLDYWKTQLSGIPQLHDLPLDKPRPAQQTIVGRAYVQILAAETVGRIRLLCQRRDVTLFMFLQAAFAVLLGRYANQQDVVLGSAIAGRTHRDVEPLIGFFVNTLVLRSKLRGNPMFSDLLQQDKTMLLDAYAHQHMPFEMLVEELKPERSLNHNPLFQVTLTLQNNAVEELNLHRLQMEGVSINQKNVQFDLDIDVTERDETLFIQWGYNGDLFLESSIERLAESFELLVDGILAAPQQRIYELPLVRQTDIELLLERAADKRRDDPGQRRIEQLLSEQAERTPMHIALVCGESQLSYQALDIHSNRLAHYLREQGVGSETLVGIALPGSLDMVIAIIAVLKAGGAYVPLDTDYPQARLDYMVTDSRLRILVTLAQYQQRFARPEITCVAVDTAVAQWTDCDCAAPDNTGHTPAAAAYVIYTSGSTGQPKGVVVEHGAVTAHLGAVIDKLGLDAADRILQLASFSFDTFIEQTFAGLSAGATLVISAAGPLGVRDFYDSVARYGITVTDLVPAYLAEFISPQWQQACCQSRLSRIVVGGEALPAATVDAWLRHGNPESCQLFNAYGPTEAVVTTTLRAVDAADTDWVRIGGVLGDRRVYVLDRYGRLCPPGTTGELYIGGACLARGYLHDAALTAERFVIDPFSEREQGRMYRSGDLVRWLPDGNLVFVGRVDDQISVRGFRVEPAEVETALRQQPNIKEAVVMGREQTEAGLQLIAYIVPQPECGEALAHGAVKAELETALPRYMVPQLFVTLEQLPLTPTGKIDKKALIAVADDKLAEREYVPAETETEKQLLDIWKELLSLEEISTTASFFTLGGHSILSVVMQVEIQETFDVNLPITTLFKTPSIRGLAKWIDDYKNRSSYIVGNSQFSSQNLVKLQSGKIDEKAPLFLVHPIGGSVYCYAELVSLLPVEQPVYGLQFSGGNSDEERDHGSIEALAGAYIDAIKEHLSPASILLGGWSVGGAIAYEMARQLGEQTVERLLLIDTAHPSLAAASIDTLGMMLTMAAELGITQKGLTTSEQESFVTWPVRSQLSLLLRLGIEQRRVPGDMTVDDLEKNFNRMQSIERLLGAYRPGGYAGRLDYFQAEDTPIKDLHAAWHKIAAGLVLKKIAGDHQSIVRPPFVAGLAEEIERLIADKQ